MTEQQVRTWDVFNADVLAVQASLPRELFVPSNLKSVAYADAPIPLSKHASMWAPKLDGKVLQALAIKPHERVLEIGTGSGYLSACLASLGANVTTVEIDPVLAQNAQGHFHTLGLKGIKLLTQDALTLTALHAFDVVLVSAAVAVIPEVFLRAVQSGGRLIAPVGSAVQTMTLCHCDGDQWTHQGLFETHVERLVQAPLKHFEF
jgi:protein-L-isoaspartate(D-aspartate) O-methyltransferase